MTAPNTLIICRLQSSQPRLQVMCHQPLCLHRMHKQCLPIGFHQKKGRFFPCKQRKRSVFSRFKNYERPAVLPKLEGEPAAGWCPQALITSWLLQSELDGAFFLSFLGADQLTCTRMDKSLLQCLSCAEVNPGCKSCAPGTTTCTSCTNPAHVVDPATKKVRLKRGLSGTSFLDDVLGPGAAQHSSLPLQYFVGCVPVAPYDVDSRIPAPLADAVRAQDCCMQ